MNDVTIHTETLTMASIEEALPDVHEWVSFHVTDLPPRAINWLVACIENPIWLKEGYLEGTSQDLDLDDENEPYFCPVNNQRQLGSLIDRESIGTLPYGQGQWLATIESNGAIFPQQGNTRAQAALRSLIARYLGNQVKVPKVWAT